MTMTVSWGQMIGSLQTLTEIIKARSLDIKMIVAIPKGGLFPAAILSQTLNIPLVDTVCIQSYKDGEQVREQILKRIDGTGEGALIVDDLVDSGNTARIVKEMLPQAKLATIYAKPKGEPYVDFYVEDVEQDVWISFPWERL